MPDYDFAGLSDSEFEFLVADLGQERFGEHLQRFERGRDAGIDSRYLGSIPVIDLADKELQVRKRNSLVIQCKHYRKSGFEALLRHVETAEVAKVAKLAPAKYVLATSVGLSPAQEDKLHSVLSPVCDDVEIWGRLAINALLGEFPEVEKQHFKLWLTSVSTIERILNNRIFNQTKFEFEEVRLKLSRYVPTDSFHRAKEMLERNRYCVVAGIPGIGKTTLAQILAAKYLEDGFKVVFASCGVKDALDISLPEVKEFFVLDDFFGQNILELRLGRNEDAQLVQFIRAVGRSVNKRLILTTREYVLNAAVAKSERLQNANIVSKVVVQMSDYGERQRAQILYNHLYFSNLAAEQIKTIVASKSYRQIVSHRNFSPRVIEWMTDSFNAANIPSAEFGDEFLRKLSDPSLLWAHVFEHQLGESARAFLVVLALARDGSLYLTDLRIAVRAVIDAQTPYLGKLFNSVQLDRDLRLLDGNFVLSRRINDALTIVNFHNPSVRDFIFSRLKCDKEWFLEYLRAVPFFEMLEFGWLFVEEAEDLSAPDIYFAGSFLLERLHGTVYGPSSESPRWIDWDKCAKFARRPPQILRRILFLLEVSRKLSDGTGMDSTLASLPSQLPDDITSADLMSLINSVSGSSFVEASTRDNVLRCAYEKLCCRCPNGFIDLNIIAEFLENNQHHQYLYGSINGQILFQEHYKSISVAILVIEDEDLLALEVEKLEMLAVRFSVDIAVFLPDLHDRIETLTKERLNDPGSWDDDGDSYRESDAYMSVGEMDSLFSSLDDS